MIIKEVVASSFLPVFIGYLKNEEDEKKGWEIASIIGNILTILFTIIVVACMLASPFVISVFAPGFKGEQRELTIKLFRIASPALLFYEHISSGVSDTEFIQKICLTGFWGCNI